MMKKLASRTARLAAWGLLLAGLALPACAYAQGNDNGRGRHKQLYAVPAPGKVVIDGKLDDWDLSGQIEMFVIQATRGTMNAKFAVMYDADAFYIGADVNDPSPMMNMRDPRTDPGRGWDADSCQFRLTTDPKVGYPILDESTFKYKGQGDPTETRDDIVHLTLWHYTATGEPQLAMQLGMTFREPQNAPRGLVPQDQFQAKYLKRPDGTGYSFEYRIPWKTLNAKAPLKGGDVVAGTVQFNYSRPDGQMTAGGAAWAYDLMREAGFPFQSTKCWGKLVFSKTGNVDRKLVLEGVPPDRPLPLDFTYTLPEDTECTIQLFNEKNENVRILVPQQQRLGGPNTERWDGCDDAGNLLPAGTYKWRGLYHAPVKAEYRFSVHNSGQPPYPTVDGKGGWGADHGQPQTACAFEGGVLLAWDGSEYGWGVIRTDFDGRKQWGCNFDATHLATDGVTIFSAGGHGFTKSASIQLMTVKEARPIQLGGKDEIAAPAGGDEKSNAVTGLACDGKELFASYKARNLVARFNPKDGAVLGTWNVPAPERLAVLPEGRLAVISAGKVLILKDGQPVATIADKLDEPTAVAAFEGMIFVANRGKLMNVSVFDATGKYLRSIGKAGGRPAKGRYDQLGLFMPGGITVDKNGQLWVAEVADAPKRISVWDAKTGGLQEGVLRRLRLLRLRLHRPEEARRDPRPQRAVEGRLEELQGHPRDHDLAEDGAGDDSAPRHRLVCGEPEDHHRGQRPPIPVRQQLRPLLGTLLPRRRAVQADHEHDPCRLRLHRSGGHSLHGRRPREVSGRPVFLAGSERRLLRPAGRGCFHQRHETRQLQHRLGLPRSLRASRQWLSAQARER